MVKSTRWLLGNPSNSQSFVSQVHPAPLVENICQHWQSLLSQHLHAFSVLVNPIQSDKEENMRSAAQQARNAIYVHDFDGKMSRYLQAQTTTDVVVVDAHRTIVYHGAIDDQYGFGYARAEPKQHFLRDAIESLLQGQQPSIAATDAPGCDLSYETIENTGENTGRLITYHREVSRILQRNCIECHRIGGIGPFPLDTYEDVVAHAGMIKTVVSTKYASLVC